MESNCDSYLSDLPLKDSKEEGDIRQFCWESQKWFTFIRSQKEPALSGLLSILNSPILESRTSCNWGGGTGRDYWECAHAVGGRLTSPKWLPQNCCDTPMDHQWHTNVPLHTSWKSPLKYYNKSKSIITTLFFLPSGKDISLNCTLSVKGQADSSEHGVQCCHLASE